MSAPIVPQIIEYLQTTQPNFLTFMLLEYYCLMRPLEIFRSCIKDYDLHAQTITLEGWQTKNGKGRVITIPNNLISHLIHHFEAVKAYTYAPNTFLFSTGYRPGCHQLDSHASGKTWTNLRKALHLPLEYKLYSFRDSSIFDMLMANIPAKVVQAHADHSSLAITSIYANHQNEELRREIRNDMPDII